MAPSFPEVEVDFMYIDNACMQVISNPSAFDVVATENMFGDILSDCASVLPGSLGLMPSASLGPEKMMFEPIGGTAFELTGTDKANPIAQILSAALYVLVLPCTVCNGWLRLTCHACCSMLRYSFGARLTVTRSHAKVGSVFARLVSASRVLAASMSA